MDYIERAAYENANGYTSYGRLCDDIYYPSVNEESGLQTGDEFNEFVSSHSNYVQFKEDYDGEILYVTRLFNNPFRYFVSEDNRIFQVGEVYIKVFEAGNVMVNADNLQALRDLTEDNLSSIGEDNPIFTFNPIGPSNSNPGGPSELSSKSQKANIGNNYYFNAAVNSAGNERIRIEAYRQWASSALFPTGYRGWVFNSIKAFRKVAWFWSDAKRTIRYSLNYSYNYSVAGGLTGPWTLYKTDYKSYTGSNTTYSYEFAACVADFSGKSYNFLAISGYVSIPAVGCSF